MSYLFFPSLPVPCFSGQFFSAPFWQYFPSNFASYIYSGWIFWSHFSWYVPLICNPNQKATFSLWKKEVLNIVTGRKEHAQMTLPVRGAHCWGQGNSRGCFDVGAKWVEQCSVHGLIWLASGCIAAALLPEVPACMIVFLPHCSRFSVHCSSARLRNAFWE